MITHQQHQESDKMHGTYTVIRQPTKNGKIGPPSYGEYPSDQIFGDGIEVVLLNVCREEAVAYLAKEPAATWFKYFLEKLKDPEDKFNFDDFTVHCDVLAKNLNDEPHLMVLMEAVKYVGK